MRSSDDRNAGAAGSATGPAIPGAVASDPAVARAELSLVLLSSGYHLRLINAVRTRFDGHAERVVLPVLLWLAARLSDSNAEVTRAAVLVLDGVTVLQCRPSGSPAVVGSQMPAPTGGAPQ